MFTYPTKGSFCHISPPCMNKPNNMVKSVPAFPPSDAAQASSCHCCQCRSPSQLLHHPEWPPSAAAVTPIHLHNHVPCLFILLLLLNRHIRCLFHALREADRQLATTIAVAPIPKTGLGLAINERLQRAAQANGEKP